MPRKKKVIVEKFEPTGQQFDAVVQGVYESQVKKHLGKKSTAPFKDRSGIRLDEKFILDRETVSKLLASAFSIATAQGQKLGTLKKGTQIATAKGKSKSAARMKDRKKLAENIADYEYTLSLARKSSPYRIVERGRGGSRKFILQPLGKEYKTLRGAKAALTRLQKKSASGAEELPTMDNPSSNFFLNPDHWADSEITSVRRSETYGRPRKPMSNKAELSTHMSDLSFAEAKGAKNVKGASQQRGKKDLTDFREPIRAFIVEKTVYLPWMADEEDEVFLMYKRAPLAKYLTIELYGPRFRFQRYHPKSGKRVPIFDERYWYSSDWGGYQSNKFKERDYRPFIKKDTEEVYWKAVRMDKSDRVSLTYRVGKNRDSQHGFNEPALAASEKAIAKAYRSWYKEHARSFENKDSKATLQFPQDALYPEYPYLECGGEQSYNVIQPEVHLGVLIRALAALIKFSNYQSNQSKGLPAGKEATTPKNKEAGVKKKLLEQELDWRHKAIAGNWFIVEGKIPRDVQEFINSNEEISLDTQTAYYTLQNGVVYRGEIIEVRNLLPPLSITQESEYSEMKKLHWAKFGGRAKARKELGKEKLKRIEAQLKQDVVDPISGIFTPDPDKVANVRERIKALSQEQQAYKSIQKRWQPVVTSRLSEQGQRQLIADTCKVGKQAALRSELESVSGGDAIEQVKQRILGADWDWKECIGKITARFAKNTRALNNLKGDNAFYGKQSQPIFERTGRISVKKEAAAQTLNEQKMRELLTQIKPLRQQLETGVSSINAVEVGNVLSEYGLRRIVEDALSELGLSLTMIQV
jgi:hypothetical protein